MQMPVFLKEDGKLAKVFQVQARLSKGSLKAKG